MKVLQLHCTKFSYKTTKKTPIAIGEAREAIFENVYVCFTTFEKKDEERDEEIVKKYVENLLRDYERLKFENVLIYPYAHLSSTLGNPKKAVSFLAKLGLALRESEFKVSIGPFGWYKEINASVKGHPFAESLREY